MPITRAVVEQTLITRCSGLLAPAGIPSTPVGSIQQFNDPLVEALVFLGYYPADFSLVTNTDLANITPQQASVFYAVAELRLLESIHTSVCSLVNQKVGDDEKDLAAVARNISKKIEYSRQQLKSLRRNSSRSEVSKITAGSEYPADKYGVGRIPEP